MILGFPIKDKMSKIARTLQTKEVAEKLCVESEALSLAGVKDIRVRIYEIKWALFNKFVMDPHLRK